MFWKNGFLGIIFFMHFFWNIPSDLKSALNSRYFVCPTHPFCTSVDECKWFTAKWFILWNKVNKMMRYGKGCDGILLLFTYKMKLFTVITYSVHDGSSLSRRTLLPIFLVAPWGCCPLLCWSTAYLAPRLEGLAHPHSSLPGWPHFFFPQGPGIFPLLRWLHFDTHIELFKKKKFTLLEGTFCILQSAKHRQNI